MPGVPPSPAPLFPPLKSLGCAHSCGVHITSPAPSYTPSSPTPTNDSRARPFHKATAFSTSCARASVCAPRKSRERSDVCAPHTRTHRPVGTCLPPLLSSLSSSSIPLLHFFSYHSISSPSLHPEKEKKKSPGPVTRRRPENHHDQRTHTFSTHP